MVAYVFNILKMNMIAAVIVFLVIFISRLTKKKYSLKWKYYMWLAVSVFLLVPVNFPAESPIRLQIDAPGDYRSGVSGAASQQRTQSQSADAAQRTDGQQSTEMRDTDPLQYENTYLSLRISSEAISIYGILEVFGVVWLTGAVISVVTKLLRCHFSLHKMIRWSYPVEDKKTLELYRWICLKKHIRCAPRLLVSPELSSPVLAGLRHTGLYLTEEEYDPEELKFILSHELTHYRHGDLWYKMLLMMVNTIYWFNPALYWMRSEAEKDIENLCDSRVVENYTKEEQMRYGRLLLKRAALQNHIPYLAASLNDSTLIFKERILYMRNLQNLRKNVFSVITLTAAMVTVQILVGSAVNENRSGDEIDSFRQVVSTAENEKAATDMSEAGIRDNAALKNEGAGGVGSIAQENAGVDQRFSVGSPDNQVGANPEQGAVQNFYGGQENDSRGNAAGNGLADENLVEAVLAENQPSGISASGNAASGTGNHGAAEDENHADDMQETMDAADFTAWVTSQQLNVRSEGSASAAVLGTFSFMDAVKVTGIKKTGGAETGWYQIDYNGTVGYVASEYLSAEPSTAETLGHTLTGEQSTLYTDDGNSATYVNRATDGNWYDGSGRQYTEDGNGQWTSQVTGEVWSDARPDTPADHASSQMSVIDAEGYNQQTLYEQADGSWQNIAGGVYATNGDGTWTGPDGTVWYGQ